MEFFLLISKVKMQGWNLYLKNCFNYQAEIELHGRITCSANNQFLPIRSMGRIGRIVIIILNCVLPVVHNYAYI